MHQLSGNKYNITIMQTKTVANIMRLIDKLPLKKLSSTIKGELQRLNKAYDDGLDKQYTAHAPLASWEYDPRNIKGKK